VPAAPLAGLARRASAPMGESAQPRSNSTARPGVPRWLSVR